MVVRAEVVREPQLVMVLVDRVTLVGNGLNLDIRNQWHQAVEVVQVDCPRLRIQTHHGPQHLEKAV
jgi:hypothetical protein